MRKIIPLLAISILSSINAPTGPVFGERAGIIGKSNKSTTSRKSSRPIVHLSSMSFFNTSAFHPISSSSISSSSSSSSSSSQLPSSSSSSLPPSTSSSSSSSHSDFEDYFYCDRYGPFPLNSTKNQDIKFAYELHTINSQTLTERIRVLVNGSVVHGATNPSFTYFKGQTRETTFTLPLVDYWTAKGMELRFEILDSGRTVVKSYNAVFYPAKNGEVSASTLKSGLYTSNSLGFFGDGSMMCELRERFDFTTIGDYIDNDYYYRLDIARNYFIYPNDFVLQYKSVYLRFNDEDNLFPYYTHESNGDMKIPLYLYANEGHICFGFKKTFYVNKRTLDISDLYQTDWVTTPHFYLPINGLKKFNGKTIYFELNGLGFDNITTAIPLKYELNRTIVGVCTDSEYCVSGGNQQ